MIELSNEMDDGDSCVTRGVESRISKHHVDKFVKIVGQSVPATHAMTNGEKHTQIVKQHMSSRHIVTSTTACAAPATESGIARASMQTDCGLPQEARNVWRGP